MAAFLPAAVKELGRGPLRLVFLSGDWVPLGLPGEIRDAFPDAEVIALGGATEATVWSNFFPVRRIDPAWTSVPYGRPIQNAAYYVLDATLTPCPVGVAGDLFIGGGCLAAGYAAAPMQTAKQFLPDPFSSEPGAVMYRTGDRAAFLRDGNIRFLGRLDHQVKVRGFRIELGEIEAVLGELEVVREAVVMVRDDAVLGRRLVAFVVPAAGWSDTAELETGALREAVADRLPEYMAPAAFVVLERMPSTANGKLDRAALAAMELAEDAATTTFVAPRNPTEEILATIFSSLLGRETVGIHDDFFALGGHSLLATQAVARIREAFTIDLPLQALFEAPVLAELARAVDETHGLGQRAAIPALVPRPKNEAPKLSYAQRRLWFLDRFEGSSAAYNMPVVLRFVGELDIAVLRCGLAHLVERHEGLRSSFVEHDGTPELRIETTAAPILPLLDLTFLDDDTRQDELRRQVDAAVATPFVLERGPLLRWRLWRLAADEHVLVFNLHHIVGDGWSLALLIRELTVLYRAFAQGEPSPLAPVALRYSDYAAWQRQLLDGGLLDPEVGYWTEELAGLPPQLELPTDRPRSAVRGFRGGFCRRRIPASLAHRHATLAQTLGATPFMTLLAVFNVLLARLSQQRDFAVGVPVAGRQRGDLEGLVGIFLNTLVLRCRLDEDDAPDGAPTFRQLVGQVRTAALAAYAHQEVPIEKLLEELDLGRETALSGQFQNPLFQVMFNMLNLPWSELELPGVRVEALELGELPAKFDLTVYAHLGDDGLDLTWAYNAELFSATRIDEMARQYELLLEQVTTDAERAIDTYSLLTDAARQVLPDPLASLDDRFVGAVHELFLTRARALPDRVAIVDPDGIWSYGELATRVESVAARLMALGVDGEDAVLIYAHRGAALVPAVLGTLLSGGTFVLLDPQMPAERLATMARAVAPRVVIELTAAGEMTAVLTAVLDQLGCRRLALHPDLLFAGMDALDRSRPWPKIDADHRAVVAFTSGTTGTPRGIAGRHGPLTHFLPWQCEHFELGADDRYTLLSGLSHDPLQRDLFTPLTTGAAVIIPDPEQRLEPGYLARWMAEERTSVTHMTPAMVQLLTDTAEPQSELPALRRAFVVGEMFTARDAGRLSALASEVAVVNLYGSTETQRAVGFFEHSGEAGLAGRDVLPLGRGMPDVQLLVMRGDGGLAGLGEAGEIRVRSPHLARGYLGDPELTTARFVDGMYLTGDMGRYRLDGVVEPLGRRDLQVKIRGYRVELGEIEAALVEHPAVLRAVVTLEGAGLAAWIVPASSDDADADDAEAVAALLREHLATRLPSYMVPAQWVFLPRLPLTATGKIDRSALDRGLLRAAQQPTTEKRGPRTATEEVVAGIWASVLEVESLDVEANFFALGGHSLLATRVISRLRNAFDVELPLRALFEAPQVDLLSQRIDEVRRSGHGPAAPPLVARPRDGEALELSFAQQRLWFLDRFEPGRATYNMPAALHFIGAVDLAVLERAFSEVIRRHESLRTTFAEEDGVARQVIHPMTSWTLPAVDLSDLVEGRSVPRALPWANECNPFRVMPQGKALGDPSPSGVTTLQTLIDAEAARPFDLEKGPLLRVTVLRRAPEDHILLVTLHHIISDGWSIELLIREITTLYASFLADRPSPLPELPVQYADFADWQRRRLAAGTTLADQLTYWRGELADVPPLDLPTDRPRPATLSPVGAVSSWKLPATLTRELQALSRQHGTTLFMTLTAGTMAVLERWSGQGDLTIGTPVAGRTRRELETLIGFFVNTLVLRGRLDRDASFSDLLANTRRTVLAAHEHQDVPFEQLVHELAVTADPSRTPLFQVMLTLLEGSPSIELSGLSVEPWPQRRETARFDLDLVLQNTTDGLALACTWRTALFDATTIRRLLHGLEILLETVVVHPDTALAELSLLAAEQRHQLLVEWNAGAVLPTGWELPVDQMVMSRASLTPDAVAVVFDGPEQDETALSFAELTALAEVLAGALDRFGDRQRFGIFVEPSLEMVVGLLGVLKAGGAYIPLDPSYPSERLAFMAEDAGLAAILTSSSLTDQTPNGDLPLVVLDRPFFSLREKSSPPQPPSPWLERGEEDRDSGPPSPAMERGLGGEDNVPADLAYMIYTSGSTGRPKGVGIEHRALASFLAAFEDAVGLDPNDSLLAVTPLSFDISGLEIFWPLVRGARLELTARGTAQDGRALAAHRRRQRVTVLQGTPATWQMLTASRGAGEPSPLAGLRALTGGEALPPALAATLAAEASAAWNLYGPTEATIWATTWRLGGAPRPLLGRPLANTVTRLLDRRLRPVPLGSVGELFLAGPGLARGYLGRPSLTAERFVPDTFAASPGRRSYRTGDLARLLADGQLEFLGRVDHQVKVRGFRIELGEIEAVLGRHPAVREGVVLTDTDGDGARLVAYLVGSVDDATLRTHLRRHLPEHMVPSLFVPLESLPLLPNGKVDRRALSRLALPREDTADHVAPRNPGEEILAGIFADLLGRERVGIDESFFELGGHSLLATRAVARIRDALGVELPLRTLFDAPRIAQLGERVDEARRVGRPHPAPPLMARPRSARLELSFTQQRLWFIDRLLPDSAMYNLPTAIRLRGPLDVASLERAFGELVRRHEALRTTFAQDHGVARQVIHPFTLWSLPVIDLSNAPTLVDVQAAAEAARPFELELGPLFRVQLLRAATDDHLLVVTLHHIVSDGWSTEVMLRELAMLYRGEEPPEIEVQYADFAAWQRDWLASVALDDQLRWWREELAGVPALELPTDRPRPAVISQRGASCRIALPTTLAEELITLSRRSQTTLFMTLMAAYQVLLQRFSGQRDFAVGTPIAGRNHVALEPLIGFFVNMLVVRSAGEQPSFQSLLDAVRGRLLDVYAHQDLPFERLVDELHPDRNLGQMPLFQVVFGLQDSLGGTLDLPGLEAEILSFPTGTAKFDLTFLMGAAGSTVRGSLEYKSDLFDVTTVKRLLRQFETLLWAVAADPAAELAELCVLSRGERHQLVAEWNDTDREVDGVRDGVLLHELFERQVAERRDAAAVLFGDRVLSYEQLDASANQLAWELMAAGVGPGDLVGVLLERSAEMVVAVLGILKAGAAYVPLETRNPEARMRTILTAMAIPVVVSQSSFASMIDTWVAELPRLRGWVALDENGWRTRPTTRPPRRGRADHLAYIIFTSGSTGMPKGVMVRHRPAINLIDWVNRMYQLGPADRVLFITSLGFDLSVYDVFGVLGAGGAVRVAAKEEVEDPLALARILAGEPITFWDSAPAALQQVAAFLPAAVKELGRGPLRLVFLSGDWVPLGLPGEICDAFPDAEVTALGGATEATVWSNFFPVRRIDPAWTSVPYGRPIQNAAYYVLDATLTPCPVGVAGDLFIGGSCLAAGYAAAPVQTAKQFLPDPFSGEPGAVMYRTGDRAAFLRDGNIRFLGRLDHQVKVRGFRIELGEIEAVLGELDAVREAVVMVRDDAVLGRRLVAFVVPAAGYADAPELEIGALRGAASERLPEYMVPAAFVILEQMPVTANGKLDRAALGRIDTTPAAAASGVKLAPRNAAERELAAIWSAVLGVDEVGVDENFFELGGDSILSIQVISRAAGRGLRLTPRQLFEQPTVAGLAAVAESTVIGGAKGNEEGPVTGEVALTPIQSWFFELDLPHREHFNQALLLAIAGEQLAVDRPAALFARALDHVLEHHDALRMRFVRDGESWRQINQGVDQAPSGFVELDLTVLPAPAQRTTIEETARTLQASLDLDRGPLVRMAFFNLGSGSAPRLLWVIHHLVVDGVSWRILLEDLESLVRRLARGDEPVLPPRTTSYRRWSEALRRHAASPATLEERAFWRERLERPVAELPVDRHGGVATRASERKARMVLDEATTRRLLEEAPRAYRTRVHEVLLTALAAAFGRWTGSPRLLVDLEGHGREELGDGVDVSRTVGWMTSIYPLMVDLDEAVADEDDERFVCGQQSFAVGAALKAVKEQLRSLPQNGRGFGLLRYAAADPEIRALPSPRVVFNYLGQLDQAVADDRLFRAAPESAGPSFDPRQPMTHLLEINGGVSGGRLSFSLGYSAERFDDGTIEELAGFFRDALERLISHCAARRRPGYTPSDFPLARLDQAFLDQLAAKAAEPIEDIYPASPLQEGLLFHSVYAPGSGVYVEQLSFELLGVLDVPAFELAWQRVVDRHAVLRTGFVWNADAMFQVVRSKVAVPWTRLDWRGLSRGEQSAELTVFLAADRERGFELATAPLMRLALIRLDEASWRVVWSHHHALLDGWSVPILTRELFFIYEAARQGHEPRLEPVRPYRDYLAWLLERDQSAEERFWRDALAGFTAPTPLVADLPGTGPEGYEEQHMLLEATTAEGLRALARQHQITLNTVIQGAWALLLSRYSGEQDVVFGAVTSGRSAQVTGLETMVGLFINTLPVRTRPRGRKRLADWLQSLHQQQALMQQHEHTPLLKINGWSELRRDQSLFESIVAFQNFPVDRSLQESADRELYVGDVAIVEQTNYPLTLVVSIREQCLLRISSDRRLFADVTVRRLLRQLRRLLSGMMRGEGAELAELALLDPGERHQLLREWNDAAGGGPITATLDQVVARQVASGPERPALVFGDAALSYGELWRRTNGLARMLRERGVEVETRVGISLPPSQAALLAILAVLQAGGTYVPLDPKLPAARRELLAADSELHLLIQLAGEDPGFDAPPLLELTADGAAIPPRTAPVASTACGENLAYIVYTSGTTGHPKGVMGHHRGAASLIHYLQAGCGLSPTDRTVQLAPLGFDASVREIFGTLAAGGALIFVDGDTRLEPAALTALLQSERVTGILGMVPSMLRTILEGASEPETSSRALYLRRLLLAGERLLAGDVARVFALWGTGVEVFNLYGTSECTMFKTWQRLRASDPAPERQGILAGRPIVGARLLVLGHDLRPLPSGALGEVYIGTEDMARGYVRRPAATAERFIPDPLASSPGARIYATGDRGRLLADGRLELFGRVDHQVKVLGNRVELGEVEAALLRHPAIAGAAVVAWETAARETRLVAYLEARGAAPSIGELRSFLQESLPEYMVPSSWTVLDHLPRLASGKIDRKLLPDPQTAQGGHAARFVAPRTGVEQLLAQIWSEILDTEQVGVRDHFFDLGGHSLSAIRVVYRLQEYLGVDLEVRALFETQTLEELAWEVEGKLLDQLETLGEDGARDELAKSADGNVGVIALGLEAEALPSTLRARLLALSAAQRALRASWLRRSLGHETNERAIPRRVDVSRAPLSWMQEAFWMIEQLEKAEVSVYRSSQHAVLEGPLDVEVLRSSFAAMAERHEILRTRFDVDEEGQTYQEILPRLPVSLPQADLTALAPEDLEAETQRAILQRSHFSFDLRQAPLWRLLLVRREPETWSLFISMHHILNDHWSMGGIFLPELARCYETLTGGQEPRLPELSVQYGDYAEWERERLQDEVLAKLLAYWGDKLGGGIPQLRLRTDRPRPEHPSFRGGVVTFALSEELTRALEKRGRDANASPFMVSLAAFKILLSRYSGQENIVVGSPSANRFRAQTERLCGCFANMLLLATDLGGDPSLGEVLERVTETVLGAFSHQEMPFMLTLANFPPPDFAFDRSPFQAMFTFLNAPQQAASDEDGSIAGISASLRTVERGTTDQDLALWLSHGERIHGNLIYDSDLFDHQTVERMVADYERLLAAISRRPEARLTEALGMEGRQEARDDLIVA